MVTFLEEPLAVRLKDADGQSSGITRGIHTAIRRQFTESCHYYRDNVNRHAAHYFAAIDPEDPPPGRTSQHRKPSRAYLCGSPENRLSEFLYNPAHWVALGRADAISIVLFDDTDPMTSVMAEAKSPINQATLAFCPHMGKTALGVAADLPSPFVDLHTLLGTSVTSTQDHPFQNEAPLLVVTRFKLGGVGVLAGGVAFQHAVIRTMAGQIAAELGRLNARAVAGDPRFELLEIDAEGLSGEGIKCTLLDGQGSEDILLLVACRNFSVGMALVALLRCITFGHVFAANRGLVESMNARRPHLMDRFYQAADRADLPGGAGAWSDNHVFSDSYTNLGVTASALASPNPRTVRGVVQVIAQVDGNPGHLQHVRASLEKAHLKTDDPDWRWPLTVLAPSTAYHRFLVGRHDFLEVVGKSASDPPCGDIPASDPLPIFHTRDYFDYLMRVVDEIRKGKGPAETGFMDFTSSVVVPFDDSDQLPKVKESSHLPLMDLLSKLSEEVFRIGAELPGLDPKKIGDVNRQLRTPWALSGAVGRLYQNFAAQLADPHLFDSVLDLYDTFATLYGFLTDYLPKWQRLLPNANAGGQISPYGSLLTGKMNNLLQAIQNAADHRVRLMLPNTDMRDTAVDLRGGLSKLVAAADVPLKCGLDLVNHAIAVREKSKTFHRVAGVTRLTFDPQSTCDMLFADDENLGDSRCLVYVSMDVGHVFRPVRFLAHIHEAAHILQLSEDAASLPNESRDPARAAALSETASEVYAELITHLMAFGADWNLFLKQYVAGYGSRPQGQGSVASQSGIDSLLDGDRAAKVRFLEILFRGFAVCEPIRRYCEEGQTDTRGWDPNRLGVLLADEQQAEDRFIEFVREFGPYYSRYVADWRPDFGTPMEKRWRNGFRIILAHRSQATAAAWAAALTRFQRTFGKPADKFGIRRAIATGRPISHLGSDPEAPGDLTALTDKAELVCRLLSTHAKYCYGNLDPERGLHLIRDEAGVVEFGRVRPAGGWNTFQIDATHSGLFCVDPIVRRERVLREVIILKTLWDVSTHFRAKRLDYLFAELVLKNRDDGTATA